MSEADPKEDAVQINPDSADSTEQTEQPTVPVGEPVTVAPADEDEDDSDSATDGVNSTDDVE